MYWHQQQPIAQSIFRNFQQLIAECILHTKPDKDYFVEEKGEDFYFASQVPFPLMNGIISNAYAAMTLDKKCKEVKDKFKEVNYPITWFWPHDMVLPQDVEQVFTQHGFSSMGRYTSIGVESNKISDLPIKLNNAATLNLVENDQQFSEFLHINQNVFGMTDDSLPSMTRLYSAYKYSNNIKLYVATINEKSVATIASYQFQNTLGIYNCATLENYRKRGLVTAMIATAVKNTPQVDYVVAQLMAKQMAKGVFDKLGFKEYSHFIPLCYGFDLDLIST